MTATSILIHATTVAIGGHAVAIRGAPGSGKSTLALELMEAPGNGLGDELLPASLISDDQTLIESRDGRLWCAAPPRIAGRMEVRGVGIIQVSAASPAPLALVVDLVTQEQAERLPDWQASAADVILGVTIPVLRLPLLAAAKASRVRVALRHAPWARG